jgi:hypothetical protein
VAVAASAGKVRLGTFDELELFQEFVLAAGKFKSGG